MGSGGNARLEILQFLIKSNTFYRHGLMKLFPEKDVLNYTQNVLVLGSQILHPGTCTPQLPHWLRFANNVKLRYLSVQS